MANYLDSPNLPTFQTLDNSLEELFVVEYDTKVSTNSRPATVVLIDLLRGVTTSIRHCTRNRHKLYRISIRANEILRQIHECAAAMESRSTETADEEEFAMFDTFTRSIVSLETQVPNLFLI
jgi:hypothetical protein